MRRILLCAPERVHIDRTRIHGVGIRATRKNEGCNDKLGIDTQSSIHRRSTAPLQSIHHLGTIDVIHKQTNMCELSERNTPWH